MRLSLWLVGISASASVTAALVAAGCGSSSATPGANSPDSSAEASATALPPGIEGLAVEEVHDAEDASVFGRLVIEDTDGPRVADGVRRVAFAEETGPETGVDG